jgi:predicted ester cyclase
MTDLLGVMGPATRATCGRMTNGELAAFYRRYNACCNAHAYDDLGEFVAHGVAINGVDRGLGAYTEGQRSVVRAFPDFRWELRHLIVDAPWIGAHLTDTGTHRAAFFGVQATGRSVTIQEFAFYRIDAGQIAEVWGMDFHVNLLEQIR